MKKMNFLPTFYISHLSSQLKRTEFLIFWLLVTLLQQNRWVRIEELASQFPKKILFESRRKKLQRFLDLPHLTIEKIWWPLFTQWLASNFEPHSMLYIAIDRTRSRNLVAIKRFRVKTWGINLLIRCKITAVPALMRYSSRN